MVDAELAARVLCDPYDLHRRAWRWLPSDRPRPDDADLYLARLADGAVGSGPSRLTDDLRVWSSETPPGELLSPARVRELEAVCGRRDVRLQGDWGPVYVCEPGLRVGGPDGIETVVVTRSMFLLLGRSILEQLEHARRGGEDLPIRGVVRRGWLVAVAWGARRRSGVWEATVFVDEKHRGQGLGRAAARAWLRDALHEGHVVIWCATWDHTLSQRTALACGYVPYAEVLS
jgi:GNAT superfamily N-acetyltransferase